jgi:Tol biopolymer transport system component
MLRPVLAIVVLAALGAVSLIGAAPAPAAYPGANGELVFTSTQDGGARHIFVTNGAGGIRDLTGVHASTQETQPEFSPSGTKIAFTRGVADSMNTQIFVMNANGTNRVALTHTSNGNGDPTWSPDGNHIAFVSDRAGGQGDIYARHVERERSGVVAERQDRLRARAPWRRRRGHLVDQARWDRPGEPEPRLSQ